MFNLFRALIDRIKLVFAAAAARELEADGFVRHAERQAELLRLADRFAAEGLHGIAANLRRQAEAVAPEQPLASVLPIQAHLTGPSSAPPALAGPAVQNPTNAPADANENSFLRLSASRSSRKAKR